MSIAIHADVLLIARRQLLEDALDLASVPVLTPATGATTGLTVAALDRVRVMVTDLARDLQGLADALAALVDDVERREDLVAARFDQLRGLR